MMDLDNIVSGHTKLLPALSRVLMASRPRLSRIDTETDLPSN